MTRSPVHIALASDDRGTVGLAVTVHSLLRHTRRPVQVWIVEDGIDRSTQARLAASWKGAGLLAATHFLAQKDLPIKPPVWWARDAWPLASCSRFQLGDVLPPEVSRCIYLDINILVGTDVGALFDHDLRGFPVAMVPNYGMSETDRQYVTSIGLDPDQYCNTGVMLMDLDAWRQENAGIGLFEQGRSMPPDIWFFDQDMLNTYFKGRCLLLDKRWNYRDAGVMPDGHIQHFAGKPKPWNTRTEEATSVGLVAWHRARAETGYVPPSPSKFVQIKRQLVVNLARIQRRLLRMM